MIFSQKKPRYLKKNTYRYVRISVPSISTIFFAHKNIGDFSESLQIFSESFGYYQIVVHLPYFEIFNIFSFVYWGVHKINYFISVRRCKKEFWASNYMYRLGLFLYFYPNKFVRTISASTSDETDLPAIY